MTPKILVDLYRYFTQEKYINHIRKIDRFLGVMGGPLYAKTLGQLKYRLRYDKVLNCAGKGLEPRLEWDYEKKSALCGGMCAADEKERASGEKKSTLCEGHRVSVFLSQYGKAEERAFLLEQIEKQSYRNLEVLTVPDRIENFPAFMDKGLQAARGDLIWVPAPDRNYDTKFLEELTAFFDYRSVMMAVCRNPRNKWESSFYMSAANYIKYLLENNGLPIELGDVLLRNPGSNVLFPAGRFPDAGIRPHIQVISDAPFSAKTLPDRAAREQIISAWILDRIRGGVVGYSGKMEVIPSNDHCRTITDDDNHQPGNQRPVDPDRQPEHQRPVDPDHQPGNQRPAPPNPLSGGQLPQSPERLHIAMVCYALKTGGGEMFPLCLAAGLQRLGQTVTIINLGLEESEPEIESNIPPSIPVVNIRHTDVLGDVLRNLNVDIIHSHNAVADYSVALWTARYPSLGKHIITLHGMYEAIGKADCDRVIGAVWGEASRYVYIADKNLQCFLSRGKYDPAKFVKIPNGLPPGKIRPLDREQLGIGKEDFVCVLASRGIAEKGWKQAIQAVEKANEILAQRVPDPSCTGNRSSCAGRIHLFLLGDGPVKKKLEKRASSCVHFTGTVKDPPAYFAMGDVGLLPTWYPGESYPLSVMECLLAGKPVIATDIAEIPNQIKRENGEQAGILLPLKKGKVSVGDLCEAILRLADSPKEYEKMKKTAVVVSKKFGIDEVSRAYLALYKAAYEDREDE